MVFKMYVYSLRSAEWFFLGGGAAFHFSGTGRGATFHLASRRARVVAASVGGSASIAEFLGRGGVGRKGVDAAGERVVTDSH